MDFYSLSDRAIAKELGQRLKTLRLQRDITQQQLAEATTLSLNTIKALEAGRGKLASLIAALRELQALEQLEHFVPEPTISPLQLVRMRGKVRERASGTRHKPADESEW